MNNDVAHKILDLIQIILDEIWQHNMLEGQQEYTIGNKSRYALASYKVDEIRKLINDVE